MNIQKKTFLLLIVGIFFSFMTYAMEEELHKDKKQKPEANKFTPSKITLSNGLSKTIFAAWYYENTSTNKMERVGNVQKLGAHEELVLHCPVTKTETASWRVLTRAYQSIKTSLGGWNVGFDRQIIISFDSKVLEKFIPCEDLNNTTLIAKSFKHSNWVEWAKRGVFHILTREEQDSKPSIEIVSGGFVKLFNAYSLPIFVRVYDKNENDFFGEIITVKPVSSAPPCMIPLPSGWHAKGRCLAFTHTEKLLEKVPLENSNEVTLIEVPYKYLTFSSSAANKIECTYYVDCDLETKRFIIMRGGLNSVEEAEKKVTTAQDELQTAKFSNDPVEIAEKEINLNEAQIEHKNALVSELLNPKNKTPKKNKLINELNDKISELIQDGRVLHARLAYEQVAAEGGEVIKKEYLKKEIKANKYQAEIIKKDREIRTLKQSEGDQQEIEDLIKETKELNKKKQKLEKEIIKLKHVEKEFKKEQAKKAEEDEDSDDQ